MTEACDKPVSELERCSLPLDHLGDCQQPDLTVRRRIRGLDVDEAIDEILAVLYG